MKATHLIATVALSLSAAMAQADVITLTQPQTVGGQNFNFSFVGLSSSFTGGGSLSFTARGDYTPTFSGPSNPLEVLTASAEGIDFGVMGWDNRDSGTQFSFDDSTWTRTFALSGAQLTALLADSVLNVFVDLDSNVNLFNPQSAFVQVSFDYTPGGTVPEPGVLALLGVALAGAGAFRRKSA